MFYTSFRETPAVPSTFTYVWTNTLEDGDKTEQKLFKITAWQGGSYYYIPLFCCCSILCFSLFLLFLSRAHTLCVITKTLFSVDFVVFLKFLLFFLLQKELSIHFPGANKQTVRCLKHFMNTFCAPEICQLKMRRSISSSISENMQHFTHYFI